MTEPTRIPDPPQIAWARQQVALNLSPAEQVMLAEYDALAARFAQLRETVHGVASDMANEQGECKNAAAWWSRTLFDALNDGEKKAGVGDG